MVTWIADDNALWLIINAVVAIEELPKGLCTTKGVQELWGGIALSANGECLPQDPVAFGM